MTGEYTKIGTIENTDEFRDAVENNPVLEGWGNKIVRINSMEYEPDYGYDRFLEQGGAVSDLDVANIITRKIMTTIIRFQ